MPMLSVSAVSQVSPGNAEPPPAPPPVPPPAPAVPPPVLPPAPAEPPPAPAVPPPVLPPAPAVPPALPPPEPPVMHAPLLLQTWPDGQSEFLVHIVDDEPLHAARTPLAMASKARRLIIWW